MSSINLLFVMKKSVSNVYFFDFVRRYVAGGVYDIANFNRSDVPMYARMFADSCSTIIANECFSVISFRYVDCDITIYRRHTGAYPFKMVVEQF